MQSAGTGAGIKRVVISKTVYDKGQRSDHLNRDPAFPPCGRRELIVKVGSNVDALNHFFDDPFMN